MTRPVRGGRTDRTWIKSLLKDVEVVCTIAPSEAYRTGMTNLGGGGSGWFWCDVGVAIGIHLESVVLPPLDATGVVRESFATRAAAAWRLMKALYRDIEPASSACSSRSNRSPSVSVSSVTIETGVARSAGKRSAANSWTKSGPIGAAIERSHLPSGKRTPLAISAIRGSLPFR